MLRRFNTRTAACGALLARHCSSSSDNKDLQNQEATCNTAPLQQAQNQNSNQQQQMLDPNTAFLLRQAQKNVAAGRMTPQAAQYMESMYRSMGSSVAPLIERTRQMMGDVDDPKDMTPYQKQMISSVLANEAGNIVAENTMAMFNEQRGLKEFAEEGTPTGENYWFEAGGTLTSPDLPRELKDDLFDEMKRDRPQKSTAAKDLGF